MTRSSAQRALKPRRGPRPAFLKQSEIEDLARRLRVRPGVVAIVLQVAGHVLRERYRRRGWLPQKRDPAKVNEPGVERQAVAEAINDAEYANLLEAAGVITEREARRRFFGLSGEASK